MEDCNAEHPFPSPTEPAPFAACSSLISLNRSLRRLEFSELLLGVHTRAVVLIENVVQILCGSVPGNGGEASLPS
jgi:hypothetical protein